MFVSVLPEDHYDKMFKALDDPEATKEQLKQLSDQHKGVQKSLVELSNMKSNLEAKQKEVELSIAVANDKAQDNDQREEFQRRAKQEIVAAKDLLLAREQDLNARDVDVSRREADISSREALVSIREEKLVGLKDDAENRMNQALDLQQKYEAHVESLKAAMNG